MKIGNSKKQLAKIISENGGWCYRFSFAAQDGDDHAVWFYDTIPVNGSGRWWQATGECDRAIEDQPLITNWHQTILSRDEYFHLYPVAEPAPEPVVEAKPTIEQLAADYRNRKDYADRKQQEADAAKADAEAKLAELVAAGEAIGLVLSVAPARRYTGKFYNAELGEMPPYGARTRETICDGCGRRYGSHFGYNCKPGAQDA